MNLIILVNKICTVVFMIGELQSCKLRMIKFYSKYYSK